MQSFLELDYKDPTSLSRPVRPTGIRGAAGSSLLHNHRKDPAQRKTPPHPLPEHPVKPLSVVVICCNEAHRIGACLASVSWADEIVVVDSFSSDATVEIAGRYTDKVYRHEWRGYGPQKGLALSYASHEWVLSLDADEVVSPELAAEIQALLSSSPRYSAYRMPRMSFYLGRYLSHCWYPDYKVRLFSARAARWDGSRLHEGVLIDGPIGTLKGNLLHYSFPTLEDHIATIQEYTSLAAGELSRHKRPFLLLKLVGSPLVMFFKLYVVKRGFLDGVPGLVASVLSAFHEFVKYAKYYELRLSAVRPLEDKRREARPTEPGA